MDLIIGHIWIRASVNSEGGGMTMLNIGVGNPQACVENPDCPEILAVGIAGLIPSAVVDDALIENVPIISLMTT